VKDFLRKVIPVEAQRHGAVGGAGSFFLYDYDHTLLDVENATSPNDVDIFVCGEYGKTENNYSHFIDSVISNAQSEGYYVVAKRTYANTYVYKDKRILITNLIVGGISVDLSFIQCPLDKTVATVVDKFDMDIVRVVYNIEIGTSVPKSTDVQHAIRTRTFTVHDFTMAYCGPSDFEIFKIRSTFQRIAKYSERGFRASDFPKLLQSQRMTTRSTRREIKEPELQSGPPFNHSSKYLQGGVFYFSSLHPSEYEIDLLTEMLTDMQLAFKAGCNFDKYPTLKVATMGEVGLVYNYRHPYGVDFRYQHLYGQELYDVCPYAQY